MISEAAVLDALRAVKMIQPKKVLPIHYNTFDLIAQDAAAWAARVRKETQAEPVVLKPGPRQNGLTLPSGQRQSKCGMPAA